MVRTQPQGKLAELILYLADACQGDDGFGKTKLNKLLFAADLTAYVELGKTITGQDYQKLDYGPAPRQLVPTIQGLQQRGDLVFSHHERFGLTQERPVALRDANLSEFSGEEIAIVTRVVDNMWGRTAKEVSDWSHNMIGWQVALDRETIPLSTVFVERAPRLTTQQKEYGRQLARDLGLDDTPVEEIPF